MADDATFEKYFPKRDNSIAPNTAKPKPDVSPYEEYFGKKAPTASSAKPDFYDLMSKSPEEARKWRESSTKSQAEARALYAPYRAALPEYVHNPQRKWRFFFPNNPNVGYKFHLNVLPENVRVVADFLKQHDYEHKYLSGGLVEDGKIFTVYTGSKQQTEQIVKETSNGIGSLLQPPLEQPDAKEIPYAPNIVGRFCGEGHIFEYHESVNGVEILQKEPAEWGVNGRRIKDPQGAFSRANKAAQERYGDYYGGGITYYQPQTASTPKVQTY